MDIVKAKFPEEGRNSTQEVTAAARVTSVTEPEDERGPTWRPEGEFNPRGAFEVINSRNAPSGARSAGLRFAYLQFMTRTQFGQEHFGAGIGSFRGRIVDGHDAFPTGF